MVHRQLILTHFKLHAKLHDKFVFGNDLVLCLLQLLVPIAYLCLEVGDSNF